MNLNVDDEHALARAHNIYLSALQERWRQHGSAFTGEFALDDDVAAFWQDIECEFNTWKDWRQENPLSMLICDHWTGNLARQARLLVLTTTPACRLNITAGNALLIRRCLTEALTALRDWNTEAGALAADPLTHPFTLPAQEAILRITSEMEALYFNLLSGPDRIPQS